MRSQTRTNMSHKTTHAHKDANMQMKKKCEIYQSVFVKRQSRKINEITAADFMSAVNTSLFFCLCALKRQLLFFLCALQH